MTHHQDTHSCLECAAPITGRPRQARYCSPECRRQARNRYQRDKRNAQSHTRSCATCGTEFETAPEMKYRQRFCSDSCRNRPYLRQRRWIYKRRGLLKGAAWWDTKPSPPEVTAYHAALRHDPCSYCGQQAGETDHITPRAHAGTNTWDNYTAACRTCNSSKASLPLLHAMLAFRIQREIGPQLDQLNLIRGVEVRQWRQYASVSAAP